MLVMTSQASEAERLITSLRDGGLPVRGMYTSHADRIEELVDRRTCDLIICCAYDPAVTLNAVMLRHLFINLAEDSFCDPGAMIWICDCLRVLDVRGSWLNLVIQEELVNANLASLNRLIESLKKIKCWVMANCFGATDHPQMLFQGFSLDFALLLPEFAQGLADGKDIFS